jgi:chromosome segregation ATPase
MPNIHPFLDAQTHAALAGLAVAADKTPAQLAAQIIETGVELQGTQRTVSNLHRRIDELVGLVSRLVETQAEAINRATKTETRIEQLETRLGEIETHVRELRKKGGPIALVYEHVRKTDATSTQILEALTAAAQPAVKK